jgi:hypothetical protein
VHRRLIEAIDGIEDFNDEFRAFERARLSKAYLADLHSIDPNHIRVCFAGDTMTGFLISGPECGNLWYYWGYVFPEVRTPKMAMVYLRLFLEHWDNSRFHKISLYTTQTNRPTLALMKRFRFEHKCDLANHVWGRTSCCSSARSTRLSRATTTVLQSAGLPGSGTGCFVRWA